MVTYSGKPAEEILNKSIFDSFPEVPQRWFKKKLDTVFELRNYAFITWEQRQYLFKFKHTRPVTGGVEYMAQNITLMPIKKFSNNDEDQLCLTINDVTDVFIYQKMLEEANQRLMLANQIDGLTQIFNRAYWERRFSEELARCNRYEQPLTIAMLDIDHFKAVNDQYGHLAGDEVIKRVTQTIKNCIREHDVFGRYGGEEFGLLLVNTELKGAATVAERIREAVEQALVKLNGIEISVTLSIGLASYQKGISTHKNLIDWADIALYESKKNGRNRVTTYNSSEKANDKREDKGS